MIRVHRPEGAANDERFLVTARRVKRGYIQRVEETRVVERIMGHFEASITTERFVQYRTFDLAGRALRTFEVPKRPNSFYGSADLERCTRRDAINFLASREQTLSERILRKE